MEKPFKPIRRSFEKITPDDEDFPRMLSIEEVRAMSPEEQQALERRLLDQLQELKAKGHLDIDESQLDPEKLWKDESIFDYYEQGRKIFRPINRRIVSDVMRKWVADSDAVIVEVGSGTGEMAQLLPDEIKDRVIQTEKTEKFSRSNRAKNPEARLVGADVYHLPLADGSADVVTGFSMFDTLRDAAGAAAEISRVLKDGGKFIHFLDLMHNDDTIFHDFEKEGKVVFPGLFIDFPIIDLNQDWGEKSYSTAPRKEIEEALDKLEDKELVALLQRYLKNPWQEYRKMGERTGFDRIIKAVKELNKKGVHVSLLNPVVYFQDKLQKVFSEAGFDLLQNGIVGNAEYFGKDDEPVKDLQPRFNFIRNKVGRIVMFRKDGVFKDMVEAESYLHVVVAQKKKKDADN